jgi:hypothetical protein
MHLKGPIHFQPTVRDIVMQHRQIKEQEEKEIWPITPKRAAGEVATKKLTEKEAFVHVWILGSVEVESWSGRVACS